MPAQTSRPRSQIMRELDQLRRELDQLDQGEHVSGCPRDHQDSMECRRPDGTVTTLRGPAICRELDRLGVLHDPSEVEPARSAKGSTSSPTHQTEHVQPRQSAAQDRRYRAESDSGKE